MKPLPAGAVSVVLAATALIAQPGPAVAAHDSLTGPQTTSQAGGCVL